MCESWNLYESNKIGLISGDSKAAAAQIMEDFEENSVKAAAAYSMKYLPVGL